jgi:hypothetical protein
MLSLQVMVLVWARGARSQASSWTTMHGAGGELLPLLLLLLLVRLLLQDPHLSRT